MHLGRAGRRAPLTGRARLLYLTAAAAYGADRVTKWLAETNLQDRPPIDLIPGVLRLRYTTNPGGAFGLFGGLTWLFVVVSVVVVGAVLWTSRDLPDKPTSVALGLVLAGALGNITDRFIRGDGFSGEVVDFIDLHVWPVFNVADMSIVFGAAILLLAGLRRRPDEPAEADGPPDDAGRGASGPADRPDGDERSRD